MEVPVDFQFHGTLRNFQVVAVDVMLSHDHGVLESGTGSGKTVMALSMIAVRKQRALVDSPHIHANHIAGMSGAAGTDLRSADHEIRVIPRFWMITGDYRRFS